MGDKHWAKAYILDPLTAPEPSQETGPGTSHYNALRSLSTPLAQQPSHKKQLEQQESRQKPHIRIPSTPPGSESRPSSNYPTPPGSYSPLSSDFSSNNPYKGASVSPPVSPPRDPFQSRGSPLSPRLSPGQSSHHRSPSNRPASAYYEASPFRDTPDATFVQRSASTRAHNSPPFRRRSVLRERYPGDMSARPLEVLTKENRTADRDHYTRHKPRKASETDIIDQLDTIGGMYHHGGPYDATLKSRNMKQIYSPVAAVEGSNNEAIKATPSKFIHDSLTKHEPLQGTSTIRPGAQDLDGKVMNYEEGVDLMREPEAGGGAYKRWTGMQYHPDDLKGKGEPNYSIDEAAKAKRAELDRLLKPVGIEMQSGVNKTSTSRHQRAKSDGRRSSSNGAASGADSDQLGRSNTTGKRLSDGIKRRLGSIRRKQELEQ